jgi:hypothetical protein
MEKTIINESDRDNYIGIIIRQTGYDKEYAEKKLVEHNMDYESVIKSYMGIKPKEEEKCITSNQQRYKMIRKAIDGQIKK